MNKLEIKALKHVKQLIIDMNAPTPWSSAMEQFSEDVKQKKSQEDSEKFLQMDKVRLKGLERSRGSC